MSGDPYSLSDLRDIVEPQTVGIWPPAPGAWLLIGLALVWMASLIILSIRRRRGNAYRRAGLAELSEIQGRLATPDKRSDALLELSRLVRRVALAAFPRDLVASLSGDAWLAFLDKTMKRRGFSQGPGQLLARIPYGSKSDLEDMGEEEIKALITTVARWIRTHPIC